MSDAITHITLEFVRNECKRTRCYALSPETMLAVQAWQAREGGGVTAERLAEWLRLSDSKLDCVDGPAFIDRDLDGPCNHVAWYRQGQRHREDGPALVIIYGGQITHEEWYRQGQLDREDGGPALVNLRTGHSCRKEWHRQGKLHRADGPAVLETWPDGTRYEAWYTKGKLDLEKKVPNLRGIPGVKLSP